MFNLDDAVKSWRRQMADGGLGSPELLAELESHLLDDMEEQMQSGLAPQPAFEAAIARIGQASVLQPEFQKFDAMRAASNARRSIFGLRLATIQNHPAYMNTPQIANHLERSWATYSKAAAFLLPAVCLWAFSAVFLFPKVQQICRDAGIAVPAAFRIVMGMMGLFREHGTLLLAVLVLSIAFLEWRSGQWPRYRRTSIGLAVFVVNSAVLVLITAMFTLALMAAPALFHTK
jgi:hypothetical protein